ncbi:MAG: hypothetical protein HOP23_09545 [Methylococcaceae bacterium]|nr:hypothetical protein [Methylococcaceae bacterium]
MLLRFFLIFLLSFFIHGCAGLYGQQPPAPVYNGRAASKTQEYPYPGQQNQQRQRKQDASGSVMTEPLKESTVSAPESIEFKPEPLSSDPEQEGQTEQPMSLSQPFVQAPTLQEPAQESATLTPFEPMEMSESISPAVDALVVAANQNSSSGNLEVASATIERAIRIEPRNGNLFYQLALIRLKQSKPRLAEDLAKKSALLAANDSTLKKHSWLLIAHARELQNNFKGAKQARAKAEGL